MDTKSNVKMICVCGAHDNLEVESSPTIQTFGRIMNEWLDEHFEHELHDQFSRFAKFYIPATQMEIAMMWIN